MVLLYRNLEQIRRNYYGQGNIISFFTIFCLVRLNATCKLKLVQSFHTALKRVGDDVWSKVWGENDFDKNEQKYCIIHTVYFKSLYILFLFVNNCLSVRNNTCIKSGICDSIKWPFERKDGKTKEYKRCVEFPSHRQTFPYIANPFTVYLESN